MSELLKVLDMKDWEQHQWLENYCWFHRKESKILADYHRECKSGCCETSLNDLAFWLRDECECECPDEWERAKLEVYTYFTGGKCCAACCDRWFVNVAQPIHWIIAALIAMEMSNG
jgi:hypothetical protein